MTFDNDAARELVEKIAAELAAGRKIEAVKLYRDATGRGLKESKDAVEAIERGAPPPAWISSQDPLDEELRRKLTVELTANRKIEAIKLYREAYGGGLKEAKEAVEQFAHEQGLPVGAGGCTMAAIWIMVLLMGAAGLAWTVVQ